jgi:hypothetical protein
MKRTIQGLAVVALALGGCPHGGAPKTETAASCGDVGTHAAALYDGDENEGAGWRDHCAKDPWSQAQIDCFQRATSIDDGMACFDAGPGAPPPVGEASAGDDPACVAAADQGAVILGNDAGADDDARARIRAAILEPCLESRYSDELLQCLSDPEMTAHFGICGVGMSGKPDWEALVASLGRAGFGPK